MRINELINETKKLIKIKQENNQGQIIDDSFLAYVTFFEYGNDEVKKVSEKWLVNFFVNSGMVVSKREISN